MSQTHENNNVMEPEPSDTETTSLDGGVTTEHINQAKKKLITKHAIQSNKTIDAMNDINRLEAQIFILIEAVEKISNDKECPWAVAVAELALEEFCREERK